MVEKTTRSVKIFYSYSHRDKDLRDELANHLGRSYISGWYDREILPGEDWEDKIDDNLNTSHIILLLISSDFIASDYCWGKEMKRALERNAAKEAYVIPIILRSVYWKDEPFSKLQVLPTGGRPITSWLNRDEAFFDVTEGIRRTINQHLKTQYILDAKIYIDKKEYEKALTAYEQTIRLLQGTTNPENELSIIYELAVIYSYKGDILLEMGKLEEALAAYDEAINLNPQDSQFYVRKGAALSKLERFPEALEFYDKAIAFARSDASLHASRGDILLKLENFDEALNAYNDAIERDPKNLNNFISKGDILLNLMRFDDAAAAYEIAIKLDGLNPNFHIKKGDTLFVKKDYDNAFLAYEKASAIDSQNSQVWRKTGQVLIKLDRFEEAVAAYEQSISLEPENPFFFKEKGDILFKMGRLEEALAAFEDAVRLEPKYGLAFFRIGVVLEELALQSYQTLKERSDNAFNKARTLGVPEEKLRKDL
jgi:tetratricopeptide (TPR) repeat protein